MISIKHKNIEKEMLFDRDTLYYLCIENIPFFRKFIRGINQQLEEEEDFLFIYDKNQQLDLGKNLFVIDNPMCFTMDEKKLNATIQKELPSTLNHEDHMKYLQLLNDIGQYLESITYDYPIRLSYDTDMALSNFLKSFSVSYEEDIDDFLTTVIEKLKILSSVFRYKIFVFLNLSDYLTKEELQLFFDEMNRLEIDFFILSNHLPSYRMPNEFIIHIDDDLCELHIDMKNQKE